jgi:hypothetical protein
MMIDVDDNSKFPFCSDKYLSEIQKFETMCTTYCAEVEKEQDQANVTLAWRLIGRDVLTSNTSKETWGGNCSSECDSKNCNLKENKCKHDCPDGPAAVDSGANTCVSGCRSDFVYISEKKVTINVGDGPLDEPGRVGVFYDSQCGATTGLFHA